MGLTASWQQPFHLGRGRHTCHFGQKKLQTRTQICVTISVTSLANCWTQKRFSLDLFWFNDCWWMGRLLFSSVSLWVPAFTCTVGRACWGHHPLSCSCPGLSAVQPTMVEFPGGQWGLHNWDENGAMGGCCTLLSASIFGSWGWRRTERNGELQLVTVQQGSMGNDGRSDGCHHVWVFLCQMHLNALKVSKSSQTQ